MSVAVLHSSFTASTSQATVLLCIAFLEMPGLLLFLLLLLLLLHEWHAAAREHYHSNTWMALKRCQKG